ncbi:MAG: DUF4358 domain-containing protein [Clostridia bacterium]|nr:DUF4358 domain-containing protein [Clostridia bacterium]
MKKAIAIISVLLSVSLCVGGLVSCGDDSSDATKDGVSSVAVNVDLSAVYGKIIDGASFPDMYTMSDDYIESYYGLTSEFMEDKVFAVAEDALLADTVAIVKVPAGVDISIVENAFKTVNDQKKLELESYNPEQYARVDKAAIKSFGQYVCYIVSDDNDAVLKIIESNIA